MISGPSNGSGEQVSLNMSRRNLAAGCAALVSAMAVPKSAKANCLLGIICIGGGGGGSQCFVRGTRILTPAGEVAVEKLVAGDLVVTASGTAKPIKWIGHRALSGDEVLVSGGEQLPIKIQRFALSDTLPQRDLFVSRGHALLIDGVLVPAGDLVNGRTITQCAPLEIGTLEYYHIELDRHDAVIAEGTLCETLFVHDVRTLTFDNKDERMALEVAALAVVPQVEYAENVGLRGLRSELSSRLRSALAPIVDRRTRFDRIRDRIEDRAQNWPQVA